MYLRVAVFGALSALFLTALPASGQAVTQSPHRQIPEGLACTACHTSEAWAPLRSDLEFDHDRMTEFSLDGEHAGLTCRSCHEASTFEEVASEQSDCASCHLDVHLGTPTRQCASCHTTASFQELPEGVVHPADFALEGAHLQISCENCHTDDLGGAFSPPERECSSCHMGDYFSSTLVDHEALDFSTYCLDCHSTLDFRDVVFDHFTISGGFELVGQHAGIECTSCHSLPDGGLPVEPSSPQDCVACHLDDYQHEHGGSGFPTDCLVCHEPSSWDNAEFDHLAATGFELAGPHAALDCVYCHVGSSDETLFSPSGAADCFACHQEDYQQVHGGTGVTTDCLLCHTGTSWAGATFDHLATSGFELLGQHAQLSCESCHVAGSSATQFAPTGPQDCYACHQAAYEEQHSGSGFTTDCSQCHSVDSWGGATFDHLATTGFELIPNHDQLLCTSCHSATTNEPLFTPTGPQDCYSCHQADYQLQHSGSGFSTDCAQCHESTTWTGATFNHPFPISGAHASADCADCHTVPSDYSQFTCTSACHHTQSRTDGQHTAVGNYSYDSQSCLNCHPTGRG